MSKGWVTRAAAPVRRRGARLLPGRRGSLRRPAKPPWHRKCGLCGCAFRESAARPANRLAASLVHLQSGSNRQRASARFRPERRRDRKSTRLNSSHDQISYAVFCLKKKKNNNINLNLKKKKQKTKK